MADLRTLRFPAAASTLVLVDFQTRLHPAIHDADQVLAAGIWLARVAARIGVPILLTEQYPKGLGPTAPALLEVLPAGTPCLEKIHFSAVAEGRLLAAPGGEREAFVVAGTEAHVCVLQTVLDLLALGRRVGVVEEAVGSRTPRDKDRALSRIEAHGGVILTREMAAFEWLERAGTPIFREISQQFIR